MIRGSIRVGDFVDMEGFPHFQVIGSHFIWVFPPKNRGGILPPKMDGVSKNRGILPPKTDGDL